MLTQFRDWLKTKYEADFFYIGKIDNAREKVIGIYHDTPLSQVEAIGKNSSYGTASLRVLIHWNQNAAETESAAQNLYETLKHIFDIDMQDIHIQYLRLLQDGPVFVGTDDNGVYEYVITLTIYYRR